MFVGKIVPENTSNCTIQRVYTQATQTNSLREVFNRVYRLALLRAVIKQVNIKRKIRFVLTKEGFLLMTIHDYKGSIQIAQVPSM